MTNTASNYTIIEPRIAPRGGFDAIVGIACGIPAACVAIAMALIPAKAVEIVTHSSLATMLAFLSTYLVLTVLLGLFTVRHIRCDAEGIEFVRTLGSPKKLLWASVESIEAVSRAEVVWQGWLFPRFPVREMTACITSEGHYRVRWAGGAAYFPPRDAQRFLYAIGIGRQCATGRRHQAA